MKSGKLFACEHFVTPDVLVLGKTLGGGLVPFAGIVTREEYNVLQHRSIGHFTHEKNPLCCTAGLATLEYILDHHLVENAAALGDYLMDQLKALQEIYPIIGNVAGKTCPATVKGVNPVKGGSLEVNVEGATTHGHAFNLSVVGTGLEFGTSALEFKVDEDFTITFPNGDLYFYTLI